MVIDGFMEDIPPVRSRVQKRNILAKARDVDTKEISSLGWDKDFR